MKVNIRYCGGCNPRYNRTALATKIREAYPEIEFVINDESATSLMVMLCGCNIACAARKEEYAAEARCIVKAEDEYDSACEFLDLIRDGATLEALKAEYGSDVHAPEAVVTNEKKSKETLTGSVANSEAAQKNLEKFHAILKSNLGVKPDELNDEVLIYNRYPLWDSVAHMEMVADLEEAFGVMFEILDVTSFSKYSLGIEILRKLGVEI